MTIFNTLFGLQAAQVTGAGQLSQAQTGLTRRDFLTGIGGLTALTIIGCGDASEPNPDAYYPGGAVDGGTDTGGGSGTDGGLPTSFGLEHDFATLPSHYPSDLHFYTDRVLGVGTAGGGQPGDRNHLFSFDPSNPARPIPSSAFLELPEEPGRFLNHLAAKPTGNRAVLTANDGLYELSLGPSPMQRFVAFPADASFGGGATYAGNKLFVATANATVNEDGTTTFATGGVLVYSLDVTGALDETSVRTIATTGKNPTGLALRGASTVVVLNSGPFGTGAEASLDVLDIGSEAVVGTIPLGALTAQVGAELAVSRDGRSAVVGTSDGSGRVLFVDLEDGSVTERIVSGTQFHSSVNLDDDLGVAYVTDFNAGTVTIFDLAEKAVIQSLMLGMGEAGPAVLVDGSLIQSVPYAAVRVYPD